MRRILEVGPATNPMHHRHGERLKDLEVEDRGVRLEEGEDYTALDQPIVDFKHRIWQVAKETYGERIHFVHGNRINMPFEDESFDELVALGSYIDDGKIISEFKRVLKPGGILRMGVPVPSVEEFMAFWGLRLGRIGFTLLEDHTQKYEYSQTI